MNKYKIIINQIETPSYEYIMKSNIVIEGYSAKDAFKNYHRINQESDYGYALNIETLNLYKVIYDKSYFEYFVEKLEKPEMNTYKIIPFNILPNYFNLINSKLEFKAESVEDAFIKYVELQQIPRSPNSNSLVLILNIETLDLYKVGYFINSSTGQLKIISENKGKLEKPKIKNNLSIKTLTEANTKRIPLFKNSKGEPAHSKSDGSDWSTAEWLQVVIGELGEYANIMKKVQRGDLTMEEAKPSIEKELADVQTYFAILADQLGVDLGQVTQDKFNEISDRVKSDIYIWNDKVYTKEELLRQKSKEYEDKLDETIFKTFSLEENKEFTKILKERCEKFNKKLYRENIDKFLFDGKLNLQNKSIQNLIDEQIDQIANSSDNVLLKKIYLNQEIKEYAKKLENSVFENHDKDGKIAEKLYNQYWIDLENKTNTEIGNDSLLSKKEKLKQEMQKIKVKRKDLVKPLSHKPKMSTYDYNSQLMTLGFGMLSAYLGYKYLCPNLTDFKHFVRLQDLYNGKKYEFINNDLPALLKECGGSVLSGPKLVKILINGKESEFPNIKVGDMIQFTDERNILYSLRVIEYSSK